MKHKNSESHVERLKVSTIFVFVITVSVSALTAVWTQGCTTPRGTYRVTLSTRAHVGGDGTHITVFTCTGANSKFSELVFV